MNACSVVIISFNEEKNIARCIESIKEIADEIVVVDSLSTDATKEVCIKHNARFIEQPFLGYIEQKNFALRQAKCDYVLSLDADEAISSELLQSIKQLKQQGFTKNGYTMNRSNYFCGKFIQHGTWYPDKKLRLFNRNKGNWGGINPHDKVIIHSNTSIQHLQGNILHYTYNNLEELISQTNKFTTIQAKAMFAAGKKSNIFKLLFNPVVAFISGYIIKLGFLDGYNGFIIARAVAYSTMLKYAKLLHLQKKNTLIS